MAVTLVMYGTSMHDALNGTVDWDSGDIYMGLLTAYTFSEDHTTWTEVKAAGTEHSTANGYTVGGKTVGTTTHAYASGISTFGSPDVVWTATGALTAAYAICFNNSTGVAIFCINFGGNVTATDAAFTVDDTPDGYFSIDVSP
jgi:hypothetical protein